MQISEKPERAYCLKQAELAVLMALMGVRRLYGFRMDEALNMNRDELNNILFALGKKQLVALEGNVFQIQGELSALLKDMAGAEAVLVYAGGEEYPECCIYIGRRMILARQMKADENRCAILALETEEICQALRESGWGVPGASGKNEDFAGNSEVSDRVGKLAHRMFDQEMKSILREEAVQCCLILYSVKQERKTRQLLLINDILENYLVLCDEKEEWVYVYTEEKADELIRHLCGGGL